MPKKKNEARAKANQLNLVSAFQLSVYSSLCGGGKKNPLLDSNKTRPESKSKIMN